MENKYFGRNTTDEDQLCNQLIDGGIKYVHVHDAWFFEQQPQSQDWTSPSL